MIFINQDCFGRVVEFCKSAAEDLHLKNSKATSFSRNDDLVNQDYLQMSSSFFLYQGEILFRHSGETASNSTTDMSKTHRLTPKQSSKTTRGNDLIFGLNCPFRPEIKMLSLLGNSGRILSQALVNFCVFVVNCCFLTSALF